MSVPMNEDWARHRIHVKVCKSEQCGSWGDVPDDECRAVDQLLNHVEQEAIRRHEERGTSR